jgi:hypothetical protein
VGSVPLLFGFNHLYETFEVSLAVSNTNQSACRVRTLDHDPPRFKPAVHKRTIAAAVAGVSAELAVAFDFGKAVGDVSSVICVVSFRLPTFTVVDVGVCYPI